MTHAGAREDEWILEQFPEGYKGYAVDVGAFDGKFLSNTLLLEEKGWTVLCVEANPHQAKALAENRALTASVALSDHSNPSQDFWVRIDENSPLGASNAAAAGSSLKPRLNDKDPWEWEIVKVPVLTLEELLAKTEDIPKVDVLSVDAEHGDADVIRGFDVWKWLPKVIIAETFPALNDLVTPQLEPYGYKIAERREFNNLYVR